MQGAGPLLVGGTWSLDAVAITFALDDGAPADATDATPCAATAVFHFDGQRWVADGRPIFNLDPAETIRRFSHELELVE